MRDNEVKAMESMLRAFSAGIETHFTRSVPGFVGMWGLGLASYLIVALILGAIVLRRQQNWNMRSAIAFITRRELYADFSARITWWHFVAYVLFWAPLFALMTFAPAWAAQAVSAWLAAEFGEREALAHTAWIIVAMHPAKQ